MRGYICLYIKGAELMETTIVLVKIKGAIQQLCFFFAMVLHHPEFDERLCAVDEKVLLERKIARTQKALESLNKKLRESA